MSYQFACTACGKVVRSAVPILGIVCQCGDESAPQCPECERLQAELADAQALCAAVLAGKCIVQYGYTDGGYGYWARYDGRTSQKQATAMEAAREVWRQSREGGGKVE